MSQCKKPAALRVLMIGAALVTLGLSRTAQATPKSRQDVDIIARLAPLRASVEGTVIGGLLGVAVDYQIRPAWRVGGYVEVVDVTTQMSDEHCGSRLCQDYYFGAFRVGPRGEWHGRPEKVVDPWLGASIGLFNHYLLRGHYEADWGVDTELDLGLDFHFSRIFTFGPSLFIIVPFVNRDAGVTAESGYRTGEPIGILYTGWLPGFPPALRISVTI